MKEVPKVTIPGAHILSAPEMNHIHICTGNHTPIPTRDSDPVPRK